MHVCRLSCWGEFSKLTSNGSIREEKAKLSKFHYLESLRFYLSNMSFKRQTSLLAKMEQQRPDLSSCLKQPKKKERKKEKTRAEIHKRMVFKTVGIQVVNTCGAREMGNCPVVLQLPSQLLLRVSKPRARRGACGEAQQEL